MIDSAIRAKHRARALQALAAHRCSTDLTDGFCGPRDGKCLQQGRHSDCVIAAEGLLRALETVGCTVVWEHDPALAKPPIRTELVDAPNYLGRIEHLYAALSLDDGGEGVCAAPLGDSGITATLVAADKQRFDTYLRPIAQKLAKFFGKPVRIAKFTAREDVEIFQP